MKNRPSAAYAIFAAAVIMLVVGLLRDEGQIVLRKAINICLECVGIG